MDGFDGQAVEGDIAYVKLPSILMAYKKHFATLGYLIGMLKWQA